MGPAVRRPRGDGTADSDAPTRKQRDRRRDADLVFLAWLPTATLVELMVTFRRAAKENWPKWRLVALDRAIRRTNLRG